MSTSKNFFIAPEPQTGTVNLTVQTGDEAAEIFVIDSQFQRVARSVGEKVEFELPRGLYSIKVRTGVECQEKPIILSYDDRIAFEPIAFASPAPLHGTAKTDEFHSSNADRYSRDVNMRLGQGSQIYVFARDWTAEEPSSTLSQQLHPACGLSLQDRRGEALVDYEMPSWPHDLERDPWAACNTEIDPGTYRLSLELPSGECLEQTVVAWPGWQTQVFLLQHNYALGETDRRADLSNASIFMARLGSGFNPQKPKRKTRNKIDFRLTEMARQALLNERQVLTDKLVRNMLSAKFSNPMLGIFSAHLLLLGSEPDYEMLRTIVTNLRKLVDVPHPDVEALALKIGQGSDYVFDFPPMLRRSWTCVLKASVRQPHILPEDSLAYQIAGQLWSGDPWLVWAKSSESTGSEETARLLRQHLMRLSSNQAEDTEGISQEFFSVPGQQDLMAENSGLDKIFQELGDEEIVKLVQALGVPRGKLETLLKS